MDIMGLVPRTASTKDQMRHYIMIVLAEEVVYRMVLLGWLFSTMNPLIAIPLSAVLFGLSHFVKFTWQMVLCATILGLINGFVYWMANVNGFGEAGYIACVIFHFIIGMGGWATGLMARWRK